MNELYFMLTGNHTKASSVGTLRCQSGTLDLYPSFFNLIIVSGNVNKMRNCLRSSAMHKPHYKYYHSPGKSLSSSKFVKEPKICIDVDLLIPQLH